MLINRFCKPIVFVCMSALGKQIKLMVLGHNEAWFFTNYLTGQCIEYSVICYYDAEYITCNGRLDSTALSHIYFYRNLYVA